MRSRLLQKLALLRRAKWVASFPNPVSSSEPFAAHAATSLPPLGQHIARCLRSGRTAAAVAPFKRNSSFPILTCDG